MENFMYALDKAVTKDDVTLENQQMSDARTTMNAANVLEAIYTYWTGPNSPTNRDLSEIGKWAQRSKADEKHSSKQNHDDNEVSYWQEKYSEDSAAAQMAESQQEGTVRAAQGQTSADATNLQMKVQMLQGINGLMSALSNMLGRITA